MNWLCRLGLHKWKNYGEKVQIFWQEKGFVWGVETHSRVVDEKRVCVRCGARFKRRLVTNPDGTFSCIGWDPITEPEQ